MWRRLSRGEMLEQKLRIIWHDLITRFAIPMPRIAVAGLNPHAGESGHLGREEIDTIIPALDKLRAEGMDLIGPLPADTLFNPPAEELRLHIRDVPRSGLTGAEARQFWQGCQRDIGLAYHPHFGGSWHRP